jgi:hypothetical protein
VLKPGIIYRRKRADKSGKTAGVSRKLIFAKEKAHPLKHHTPNRTKIISKTFHAAKKMNAFDMRGNNWYYFL